MKAGQLRHLISFRRKTVEINAYGTPVETGATVWTARAALVEDSAQETIRDGAEDKAQVKFHLRFDATVAADCDLLFRGQVFNIKRITPLRNDREMTVEAELIGGVE